MNKKEPFTEPAKIGVRRSSYDVRFQHRDSLKQFRHGTSLTSFSSSEGIIRFQQDDDISSEQTVLTKVGLPTSLGSLMVTESMKTRPRWRTRFDYMLSCFGFAVGLPSVWRFPYVCYENGGGSFLLAYLILSVTIAIPMYQLELSLGQSLQSGFLRIWPTFSNRLAGLGLSSVILASICAVYFSAINSWTLLYFLNSFTYPHPWHTGGNSAADSALKYYYEQILHKSASISSLDLWNLNIPLLLCLVLSCLLVFLAISGGTTRTTVISTFSALFPVFGLLTLFTHAINLDGSLFGLRFFLTPSLTKLLSVRVWGRALLQVFFSCGIGWGSLVNFASFSEPRNDFQTDAWIVLGWNVVTSLLAGLTTFALLGHVAKSLQVSNLDNVMEVGSGIIFVVFPAVLEESVMSRGLTALFFLLIVSLGLSSILTMVNLVQAGLDDLAVWPSQRQVVRTSILTGVLFLLAVPLILPNGGYLIDLLDSSTGAIALLAVPLAEVLAVTRVLKYERFAVSVRRSTGTRLRVFFRVALKYVVPCLLVALIVGAVSDFHERHTSPPQRTKAGGVGCVNECTSAKDQGVCNLTAQFCECRPGWEGLDCNTPLANKTDRGCPELCNRQGICDYRIGQCKCNTDFQGRSCSEPRYNEAMPAWTVVLGWGVALGSLGPGLAAWLHPPLRAWLLAQMAAKDGWAKDGWAKDGWVKDGWVDDSFSEDDNEQEDSRLGMVTYHV